MDEKNMAQAISNNFISKLLEFFRPHGGAFMDLYWEPSKFHYGHVG